MGMYPSMEKHKTFHYFASSHFVNGYKVGNDIKWHMSWSTVIKIKFLAFLPKTTTAITLNEFRKRQKQIQQTHANYVLSVFCSSGGGSSSFTTKMSSEGLTIIHRKKP